MTPRLSPAQLRVRDALLKNPDFTNAELGDELGISEKTTKNYMSGLLEAYRVGTRAGLVAELVLEDVRARQQAHRCPCCGHDLE